jgi:hypothetical protein
MAAVDWLLPRVSMNALKAGLINKVRRWRQLMTVIWNQPKGKKMKLVCH